jgi:membrane fusion protein (multidrug efflux system)
MSTAIENISEDPNDPRKNAVTNKSPMANEPPPPAGRKFYRRAIKPLAVALAVIVLILGTFWLRVLLSTASTDDAYVNGHVTFLAPRVSGQVAKVNVDDNNRVHRGDVLVELDKIPYQAERNIAEAAVDNARTDLTMAQANTRGLEGQLRSQRFALDRAIEDVDNQVALLRSKVAAVSSARATLAKAQGDYDRVIQLADNGAVSKEEIDRRKEALAVSRAELEEALQGVYQVRLSLGLSRQPQASDALDQVPPDLNQTFSSVRQAQFSLIQTAAQLGVVNSFDLTPKQLAANFYQRDPSGNIDVILKKITETAPAIQQAKSKLNSAMQDLALAQLNLQYCDVVADIDGVVTGRNVNPGNNVIAGQSLMAVRSLNEIWVDANFKETQLRDIRIGQLADLDVDMYGRKVTFKGRVSGFTNGTGSTLALLPAENATGNYVKVVQRLPVRIDLVNYNPDEAPLFVGLSVTPTVYLNSTATGPDAGKVLQQSLALPTTNPSPQLTANVAADSSSTAEASFIEVKP